MRARLDVSSMYSRSQNGVTLFLRQNLKALILIGANFRDFLFLHSANMQLATTASQFQA